MNFNKMMTVCLLLLVFSVVFICDIHGKDRRKSSPEKLSDYEKNNDEGDQKVKRKKSTKVSVDREQIFDVRKNEKKKSFNYYLPPDTMKARIDKDKRKRRKKVFSNNDDFTTADDKDNNDRDIASSVDKIQNKNTTKNKKSFESSRESDSKSQQSTIKKPLKVTVIVENEGFEGVVGKNKAGGNSRKSKKTAGTPTRKMENADDYDDDYYSDDYDYYDDDDDEYDDYDGDYDDDYGYDDDDYDDDDYDDDDEYDDDDYDDDEYDDDDGDYDDDDEYDDDYYDSDSYDDDDDNE